VVVATSSSTDLSAATRHSLFSIAINLQSKFTFTPGVTVTDDREDALPAVINLSGSVPASASKGGGSPGGTKASGVTTKASGDAGGGKIGAASNASGTSPSGSGGAGSPSNSNSGFNAVKSKLHPKTAELLVNRRAHGSASLQSYYGHLDVLENQSAFDDAGIWWNKMFLLGVNNAGKTNVVEYEKIKKEIKEMGQEILFEVFCDKYTNAYAG